MPRPVRKYMTTKRMTSVQLRALPQTCQPATMTAMKGITVTRPVMIRSRVSFSTGWMSEGSGPTVVIGADDRGRGLGLAANRFWVGSPAMPFANTAPLRREIETRLPERPFTIEFWDGSSLPSTSEDGPTFSVRSPKALAHALRAPGQLGLGRAYVSGELEVDDIEAALDVLDSWQAPSLDPASRPDSRWRPPAPRACGCRRARPSPSCARAASATAAS